jgi:hypothetical protein
MSTERTNERCTPRRRWYPEQSRQMSTPYVTVAHVGLRFAQSKQLLFAAFARSLWNHASRTSVGTYTGLPLMVLETAWRRRR